MAQFTTDGTTMRTESVSEEIELPNTFLASVE